MTDVVIPTSDRIAIIVESDDNTVVVPDCGSTNVVVIEGVGQQGPAGEDGNSGWYYDTFEWGDAARTIATALANKHVVVCKIIITEVFNGTGAAIEVGDLSDADSVMTAAQNLPTALATYEVTPQKSWGTDTAVRLTITPGSGASSGAGIIILQIEE